MEKLFKEKELELVYELEKEINNLHWVFTGSSNEYIRC